MEPQAGGGSGRGSPPRPIRPGQWEYSGARRLSITLLRGECGQLGPRARRPRGGVTEGGWFSLRHGPPRVHPPLGLPWRIPLPPSPPAGGPAPHPAGPAPLTVRVPAAGAHTHRVAARGSTSSSPRGAHPRKDHMVGWQAGRHARFFCLPLFFFPTPTVWPLGHSSTREGKKREGAPHEPERGRREEGEGGGAPPSPPHLLCAARPATPRHALFPCLPRAGVLGGEGCVRSNDQRGRAPPSPHRGAWTPPPPTP